MEAKPRVQIPVIFCGDGHAAERKIERLTAENSRLRRTLLGIAEFCSTDGSTLGALERLAHIRNTADRVLRDEQNGN
jgi:hypothetical protein